MKKIISVIAFVFFGFLGSSQAQAGPLTCGLTFEAHGGGLQFIVGWYGLKGIGTLSCVDVYGNHQHRQVGIRIGGNSPIAGRIAFGGFQVYGATAQFGLNHDMNDIYGSYLSLGGQGSLLLGAGASFSVQHPRNGFNLNVNVSGVTGVGMQAGFSTFEIYPLF